MPLRKLRKWAPFSLDALGLVTLLGAEEVDQAIGRLVYNRYTTFLPLLGQFLICGNRFTAAIPGFTLFNLTDAITTTCIAGWFSRWLRTQELKASTTVFEWTVLPKAQRERRRRKVSFIIGFLIHGGMITLTTIMGDWWGVGNSIALAGSALVRWCLVRENNKGLDEVCERACHSNKLTPKANRVKVLVTLSDGRLVTIYAPRGLVTAGFLKQPTPVNPSWYKWARRFGWLFFAVHVVVLGQCDLVTQLITVCLLAGSTWLVVHGFGCNVFEIGDLIRIQRLPESSLEADRRMWAYAKLQPTADEEDSLLDWNLLPRKVNKAWWNEYELAKQSLISSTEKTPVFSSIMLESDSDPSINASPGPLTPTGI